MYTGSCLCGQVQFEITGKIEEIVCCHCSQCRRAQGSAFATNANVRVDAFKFTQGESVLTKYPNGEKGDKYFCACCGSPMLAKFYATPDKVRIRLGTIKEDITEQVSAHIYVGSKANWDIICEGIPQRETR